MITVNPSTRHFNVPGSDLVFGVTDDSNAEIKEFQCPRYVGNSLDLMGCFIRINYRNGNGEIDSYLVPELTLDGDNIRFGWELTPKVTMYKGNISFVMCAVGPDTKVKWHTTLGRGQVLEGLEPDNAMIEEGTADVVAQLIALVESQAAAVEKAGADQVAVVKAAAKAAQDSAVAEIEAKRKNSLESIPADYTSLEDTVDGLVRGRAGAIVCEVSGSAVAVNDASDNYICGLRIFGRSTQDGTPTPDAPVEIVSVESPVVTVCGKNLLNIDAGLNANFIKENDVYTLTRNEDASRFSHVIPLNIPANTRVMFSFELVEHTKSSNNLPFYYIGESGEDYYLSTNAVATSVYTEAITGIRFYLQSSEEIGAYIRFKNVQIEVGSERTAYEPYKPVQTVETTHTLRGIPVESGGNYTDENGQQWICDEINLERGVYVQRVDKKTLAETDMTSVGSGYFEFGSYAYTTIRNAKVTSSDVVAISDRLLGIRADRRSGYVYDNNYRCYAQDGIVYLRFPAGTGEKTLAECQEVFTGATIQYALATPIETPLSETEIATYRALRSNYQNTTILNDAGAHMAVKYAADTKLYIDNKIAALIGG